MIRVTVIIQEPGHRGTLEICESISDQDWEQMRCLEGHKGTTTEWAEADRRHERRRRFVDHLSAKFANLLTNALTEKSKP